MCKHPRHANRLRLPAVAKARTPATARRSGVLAARFGGYEAAAAKGRKLVYREVRRDLLEAGKLAEDDRQFLERECTDILVQDGIIIRSPGSSVGLTDWSGQPWTFPKQRANSGDGKPGWEALLRYCRKGFTGVPQAQTLRWDLLKPDALLKCVALLADLAAALAFDLTNPIDLYAVLNSEYGLWKPVSGYDGAACRKWLQLFEQWSVHLRQHSSFVHLCEAVLSMRTMLKTALSKQPDVEGYCQAASRYHWVMLERFCKTKFRIYEHIMLVHVPSMLLTGTLLDGSSWFLEALNKTWKQALLHHTDCGGGTRGLPKADEANGHATAGATEDDVPYEELSGLGEQGDGPAAVRAEEHAARQAGVRLQGKVLQSLRSEKLPRLTHET